MESSRAMSVGEMTTTLAHEINQPLATIVNCLATARTLLAPTDETSPLREALELALEQAEQAGAVVARIREFVREREPRGEPYGSCLGVASSPPDPRAAENAAQLTDGRGTQRCGPLAYLVDDHRPFRRSTAMLLESADIRVKEFESGAQLLQELEREPAPRSGACVVSDIQKPNSSGLVLLEELRRREQTLRVIFVTAHADVSLAVEAMRRGAVDFIEKPFEARIFIQAVQLAALEDPLQSTHPPGATAPNA